MLVGKPLCKISTHDYIYSRLLYQLHLLSKSGQERRGSGRCNYSQWVRFKGIDYTCPFNLSCPLHYPSEYLPVPKMDTIKITECKNRIFYLIFKALRTPDNFHSINQFITHS